MDRDERRLALLAYLEALESGYRQSGMSAASDRSGRRARRRGARSCQSQPRILLGAPRGRVPRVGPGDPRCPTGRSGHRPNDRTTERPNDWTTERPEDRKTGRPDDALANQIVAWPGPVATVGPTARLAGHLRFRAGRASGHPIPSGIDAIVASQIALAGQGVVFTTVPSDLQLLLADHPQVMVDTP